MITFHFLCLSVLASLEDDDLFPLDHLAKFKLHFTEHNKCEWQEFICDRGGNFLLIYICNFHVLSHLLLIYICKLHWNRTQCGLFLLNGMVKHTR